MNMDGGELTSLDDYVARCTPEQNEIYYLSAPSRTHGAEMSDDAQLADGTVMSDGEVSRGAPRHR